MDNLPFDNDPELSGKYLGEITEDFVKISNTLREGAYQMRKRNISDYPIFAISKEGLPLGQLLIGAEEGNLSWNFYFSYLEEFLQRDLIGVERQEDFMDSYKDPDEFCCLFVVDKEFVRFVYIPYPED